MDDSNSKTSNEAASDATMNTTTEAMKTENNSGESKEATATSTNSGEQSTPSTEAAATQAAKTEPEAATSSTDAAAANQIHLTIKTPKEKENVTVDKNANVKEVRFSLRSF